MDEKFKACLVDGCNKNAAKPGSGRGYCGAHYRKLRRYGDPLAGKSNRASPEECIVDGCSSGAKGKQYCIKHYLRYIRHGDPVGGGAARNALSQWIEDHKDYDGDGCLRWPYGTGGDGRGLVTFRGKRITAPRAMCFAAHGEPPTPQHEAAHSCGKGHEGCTHPKHLRWATVVENHADKVCHGTAQRGEKQWAARLTRDDVRQIRRLSISMSHQDIADLFGIDQSHATNIINRKAWAWLP